MTIDEKYDEQIEKIKASDFDPAAKTIMVEALEDKRKAETRAVKAKRDRASDALFIKHYALGCPECQHQHKPTTEEVDNLLTMREVSNIKL